MAGGRDRLRAGRARVVAGDANASFGYHGGHSKNIGKKHQRTPRPTRKSLCSTLARSTASSSPAACANFPLYKCDMEKKREIAKPQIMELASKL